MGCSVSHHIFCAGAYSVPFARLSARCLDKAALAALSAPGGNGLRIFIHCDGFPKTVQRQLVDWLREEPGVVVTYGWFGMRHREKHPVNWHQRMINRTCEVVAQEEVIAIVDADLFLADGRWFHVLEQALDPNVFGLSWGLRASRTLIVREGSIPFQAMKTCLFTLRPRLFSSLNTQKSNADRCVAQSLLREFPGAQLALGEGMDTLVGASLRAQALGWKVVDIEQEIGASHIGGFSHMDLGKLRSGGSGVGVDRWLQRLRLMRRVLETFSWLGWSNMVDASLRERVEKMHALVQSTPELRERFGSLKPNADERQLPQVLQLLGLAHRA
jgi:hypothetical protein